VLPPLALDASSATWREDSIGPTAADDFVGVLAVNVLHISPFAVTEVRVPCPCRTSCRRRCIRWVVRARPRRAVLCVVPIYERLCAFSASSQSVWRAEWSAGFQNRRDNSLLAPCRFFSSLVCYTVATVLYQLGSSACCG